MPGNSIFIYRTRDSKSVSIYGNGKRTDLKKKIKIKSIFKYKIYLAPVYGQIS